MKPEEAKKIASDALATLSGHLKAGRSDQLIAYLAAMGRFHRYSINNLFLILSQCPDAQHVAGFQTWKQLGRWVRKGEKGIVILAPMLLRPKEEAEAGTTTSEKPVKPFLRFRAVYVFDVSQTDGEPLPETVRFAGDPSGHLDRLKRIVAQSGITLRYGDLPPGALGVSRGGSIGIQPGLPPAEEFAVLVHEFAHERLHHGNDRPNSKTIRETEAEAIAFVVATGIGLNAATASSDYISLYDGDSETLAASLDRIQRTATEILIGLIDSHGGTAFQPTRSEAAIAMDARQRCR